MSTTPTQKDQIVAKLERIGEVKVRPMMGEYLVYVNGIYCANICDGSLLLKITPANESYELPQVLPYASAKRKMFKVVDLDNVDFLRELILATVDSLAKTKSK